MTKELKAKLERVLKQESLYYQHNPGPENETVEQTKARRYEAQVHRRAFKPTLTEDDKRQIKGRMNELEPIEKRAKEEKRADGTIYDRMINPVEVVEMNLLKYLVS